MSDAIHESKWVKLLAVSFFAAVFTLPLAMYGCGPEWARWDAAQARQFFRDGETEDALYQLRDAVRKSPRDPVVKLTLATSLIEDEQLEEGLALANEVLELYPKNAQAMQVKTNGQQRMGDFAGGLETYLEYDRSLNAFFRAGNSLNEIAYYRALAEQDLHLAKRDIEDTIARSSACAWRGGQGLLLPTRAIVVAALVARFCDAEDLVMPLLSEEITRLQDKTFRRRSELTKLIYDEAQLSFRRIKQTSTAIELRRSELRQLEKSLATLLTCRALIFQDRNQKTASQIDRIEVQKLGFDASAIALSLPDEKLMLLGLYEASVYLDTRGFVTSRLPWVDEEKLGSMSRSQWNFNGSFESSLRDLNVALVAARVWQKSIDCPLYNSVEFYSEKLETQARANRDIAVMLNHRAMLLRRRGDLEAAAKDETEIRELGFEPGNQLF